jgi:hypothetical protein
MDLLVVEGIDVVNEQGKLFGIYWEQPVGDRQVLTLVGDIPIEA